MSKKKSRSKSPRLQKYKSMLSDISQRFPKWKAFAFGIIVIIGIIIVLTTVFWPSNTATTAQKGDTVNVSYIGTYDNGSVFDSAGINGSAPFQFTIGNTSMIPGFVKGVIGMSVNETKTIHVTPQDGYGPSEYIEDINTFPSNVSVGQYYDMTQTNGVYIRAQVTAVNESTVTLQNLNPNSGKNLNFRITLIELVKAK